MESSDKPSYGDDPQGDRMNNRITEMKKRHISELREQLTSYKTLTRRDNKNLDYSKLPNNCNMIVFGPSKSGKSSLIK
jgi:ribosome biogenesis GTPase A